MKKNEQSDTMTVPEMISFVNGRAQILGDPESITAAKRVEIALTSIANGLSNPKPDTCRQGMPRRRDSK
jgi:hypothetical protein